MRCQNPRESNFPDMKKMERPPIAVFGFIRHEELSKCLSSLENNEGASEFSVYIFIDGPRTESDLEPIKKTRAVALGVWGFKSVEVKISNKNLGLSNSRFKLKIF
jgi:GT2 family glycosyltransferase